MQVITIANRKGGIGKTTTSKALGEGLRLKGYKVLFIDLDTQKNFINNNSKLSIYEVITGRANIKEAIENDSINGSEALALAEIELNKKQVGKEYILKEALNDIKGLYDYVIIDTPPEINILTINALTSANSVILPTTCLKNSLNGINLILESINDIKKYCKNNIKHIGVLINMFNGRSTLNNQLKEILGTICNENKVYLYQTYIRNNIAIAEAEAMNESIYKYAPKSNGSKDYLNFVDEFLRVNEKKGK